GEHALPQPPRSCRLALLGIVPGWAAARDRRDPRPPLVHRRAVSSGAEITAVRATPAVRLLHWRLRGAEPPGIGSVSAALLLLARGGGGRRDIRLGRASLWDHVLGSENASRLEQVAGDASADQRRDDE